MKISIERIIIDGISADERSLRRDIERALESALHGAHLPAESRDAALIRAEPIQTAADLPKAIATRIAGVLEQ